MRKFGETLKAAREKKELSRLRLSENTGVNRATIRAYEESNRTYYTDIINKLCLELNLTPNELLSYGQYNWGNYQDPEQQEAIRKNQIAWCK